MIKNCLCGRKPECKIIFLNETMNKKYLWTNVWYKYMCGLNQINIFVDENLNKNIFVDETINKKYTCGRKH